jgi:hypothetical protein
MIGAEQGMARSTLRRVFGFVILLACLLVAGAGVWVLTGHPLFVDEVTADDEDDEDDDTIDTVVATDGGKRIGHTKRTGKRHPRAAGKHKPPAPRAAAPSGPVEPGGPTYEAALAGNREHVAIGESTGPDLTDLQLTGPMRNATFLGACGAPDSMHVTVKVAVRGGRAVGVSVYTSPPDAHVAGCIDRAVRGLAWPVNPKMDSFVTTY